jgi:TRAP-type C4-dicarboxylate transport system permease small subunit
MKPIVLRVGRWLRRRAENVSVFLLAAMFICFILQIVFRYVIDYPLGWTEEVSIFAWIWVVLWGAAFVLSEADEIRFDIFYSNVSECWRRVFTIITGVVLIALYGASLPVSYAYVAFMRREHSAYLHIPINYLYSIYVIFAAACISRYVWLIWNAIRGGRTPLTDPSRLTD